jgi:hypothetical protein
MRLTEFVVRLTLLCTLNGNLILILLSSSDLGVDGRIILKRIFKKWDAEAWTVTLLRIWTGRGLL